MAKTLPFLLLFFLFTACQHDKPADPAPLTTKITLNPLQLLNDSTAVLSWSVVNNPDFVDYRLIRQEDSSAVIASGSLTYPSAVIYSSRNIAANTCRDSYLPYTTYVQYQVIATLASGQTIVSNVVAYRRPAIKSVRAHTYDVLFDSDSRSLFFIGKEGTITKYSLATKQVTQTIEIGQPIGYGSLATFQGVKELYVPSQDGHVFIYDAATLQRIDGFVVSPLADLTSVMASNGQLYISTTHFNGAALRVHDRASKAELATTGSLVWSDQRLKPVPSTATEFIAIPLSTYPPLATYYHFSAAGTYQDSREYPFQGSRSLDGRLFEFFPASDRYITGVWGDVFAKNTAYQASLPRTGRTEFTCYGFDETSQTIYAGTTAHAVQVFSMNGYSLLRTLKTKLNPVRIFKDGSNGFVCLSSSLPADAFYTGNNQGNPREKTPLVIEYLP